MSIADRVGRGAGQEQVSASILLPDDRKAPLSLAMQNKKIVCGCYKVKIDLDQNNINDIASNEELQDELGTCG